MGLRSFLKNKVTRNRDNPQDNNKNASPKASAGSAASKQKNGTSQPNSKKMTSQQVAAMTNGKGNTAASDTTAAAKKQVRMGTDPETGEIDVASHLGPETPKERINRIKRGDMSQAEKEAFLKSALSTGATPVSRLPLTSGRDTQQPVSASPFPTDSILRNMAMGTKADSRTSSMLSSSGGGGGGTAGSKVSSMKMDSQSKKRQYLDMVTNPARFKTLKSNAAETSVGVAKNADDNDSTAFVVSNLPADLGDRLGAAAMEDEKRQKELRQQREELEKERERQRSEREKRLAEATRQRQEELAKREVEILRRKKEEESQLQRLKDEKRKEEEARVAQMMKAQDDYWSRKLAAEKAARNKLEHKQEAEIEEDEQEEISAEVVDEYTDETESEEMKSEEGHITPEFMNDVRPRFSQNDMINRAASEVFGQQPLNDVVGRARLNDLPTRASILDDATQKRKSREQEEQHQLERLKAMNSPLPASKKPATGTTVRPRGTRKSNFQPQVPVSSGSPQSPSQSLGDITKSMQNAATETKKAGIEAATAAAAASEAALKSKSSYSNPFSFLGKKEKTEEEIPVVRQVSSPIPPPAAATPAPSKPAPAKRASPPPAQPKRSGPIRMELPLVEEDDDEDAALTEGMTIGEIMKRQQGADAGDQSKRSKQWGVDMSRFKE